MASYVELYSLALEDAALRNRVVVACQEYAANIIAETAPSVKRKDWATLIMTEPAEGIKILWAVLIANKGATVAQITSAPDISLFNAVKAHVDKQYGAT